MSRGIVAIRKQLSRYALREREWNATLGNGAGVVKVPGKNHMNYVMVDGHDLPMVVANYSTSYINGLRVTVGKVSGELVVKKYKPLGGWDPKHNPTIGQHAPNHAWGGPDVGFWSTRQFLELAAYTAGGMVIKLMPGVVQGAGGTWRIDYQTIDLTSHIPLTDVRFALIAVDLTDGSISITDGEIFVLASYDVSYIPATPANQRALWAIRLYADQTAISDSYTDPDLVDLRFSGGGSGTSSGATGHVLYHADGTVTVYPASAAGITAMMAAATSTDWAALFPGAFALDATIPCSTYAPGTLLQGTITLATDVHLTCKITATETGATVATCIEGPATGGAALESCTIIASQEGTGSARCIHLNGGWVSGQNSYFRATAADAGATARIITSAGEVADCVFEHSTLANALDLDTAPDANWGVSDGVTAWVGDCEWPEGWVPTGIAYMAGDKSPINHNHAGVYSEIGHTHVVGDITGFPPGLRAVLNRNFI